MFQEYNSKQDKIYDKFRATMRSIQQLQIAPCVKEPTSGYIVAFRHSDTISQKLERFSANVAKLVPSMRFNRFDVHTTITVYRKQPLDTFNVDSNILDSLRSAFHQIDTSHFRSVRIDYQECLFNSEAVIVAGKPNDAFWQVGESLRDVGKQYGLDLRMPWGGHITVGRYLNNSDKISELSELVANRMPKLGISTPVSVVVGYYECSKSGFRLFADTEYEFGSISSDTGHAPPWRT